MKTQLQSMEKEESVNDEEYKATILSLINKLEAIKKAYDEGDYETCENHIDIGLSILASLNIDDKNTQFIKSQFDKWSDALSIKS